MSRLRAPGVYFEPADAPARAVAEVRTDVAAFVGVAERGPLHAPVRVENWTQFRTRFGDPIPEGFLAHAVRGFFANGGRTCWVVRVGNPPPPEKRASLLLVNRNGHEVFRVTARDFGPGTEQISVRVQPATKNRFTLVVRVRGETLETWSDLDTFALKKTDPAKRNTRSRHAPDKVNCSRTADELDAVAAADAPTAVTSGLRDGSVLIELTLLHTRPPKSSDPPDLWVPVGVGVGDGVRGPDGHLTYDSRSEGRLGLERPAAPVLNGLTTEHFTGEVPNPETVWGLRPLALVEDIGIVAAPDLMWPGFPPPAPRPKRSPRCRSLAPDIEPPTITEAREGFSTKQQAEAQRAIIRHCAALRDRFAILDTPARLYPDPTRLHQDPAWLRPDEAVIWAAGDARGNDGLRSDAGQFAGLYYPWLFVPTSDTDGTMQAIPPSGHVAGVFARVDRTAGVQKPPANEAINGVSGAAVEFDTVAHGLLNDEGVNAIRSTPGRGVRVVGARTLIPPGAPELRQWRYVNVRRLLMMLEASIERATQWVVFEPNAPVRWREVDRVIRNFLDDEWRKGRLDGATAEDAYEVTCDESTNPPERIESGQLVCEIGVQPPLPAEFVVVRLGRRVGEDGGAGTGGVNGG